MADKIKPSDQHGPPEVVPDGKHKIPPHSQQSSQLPITPSVDYSPPKHWTAEEMQNSRNSDASVSQALERGDIVVFGGTPPNAPHHVPTPAELEVIADYVRNARQMNIEPSPLYVVPKKSPLTKEMDEGAMADQTKEGHPFVLMTEGMVKKLTPRQLGNGLLSHEEAHVALGDTRPEVMAAMLNDPLDTARAHELRADLTGAQASGDPQAMIGMLQTFQREDIAAFGAKWEKQINRNDDHPDDPFRIMSIQALPGMPAEDKGPKR